MTACCPFLQERRENVAAMKKAQTGFCDQFFLFNLVPLLQVAALQLCPRLAYLNECDGSLGEPRCQLVTCCSFAADLLDFDESHSASMYAGVHRTMIGKLLQRQSSQTLRMSAPCLRYVVCF